MKRNLRKWNLLKFNVSKLDLVKSGMEKSFSPSVWEEAFSVPAPQRKMEFLAYLEKENSRRLNDSKTSINMGSFIFSQVFYIRKRVYLISLAVLAASVLAADYAGAGSIWYIAAMMPFVALCMVSESARSEIYGMAELEMASRFSIKSILMARFGTIGLVHMILLCILIPIVRYSTFLSFVRVGIYLLVPYLAASVLELAAVRRFQGKEGISVCMGISVMVGWSNYLLEGLFKFLFGAKYFISWTVLAVYLTGKVIQEYRNIIYRNEEWLG